MISSTPSPSISPAKSSLVITSPSKDCASAAAWVAWVAWAAWAAGGVAAAGSAASSCACACACACALGLRPRRLGSAFSSRGACTVSAAAAGAGAGALSIGSSGSAGGPATVTGGRCAGAVFSVFVLVMRGRRPRGAWGTVSGAVSAFAAAGSAIAAVCCISVAGTSFFRPRPLFSLFSAGAPSEAENPAIFSISSRFFNVVSPMPIAFAISRSSTRLFPSSAFKSCIYFYFKVIFRTPAGAGTLEFACKDSALFRNSK